MLPNTIQKAVLAKLVKDAEWKKIRPELTVGSTDFDFTVRVVGRQTVEKDTEKTPTSSLLNIDTVALILAYAGVTGENAMKAIARVCGPAMAADDGKAAGALANVAELKEKLEKGKELFAKYAATLPKVPVNGDVSTKISLIEIVSFEPNLTEATDSRTIEERISDLDTLMAKEA